MNSTKHQFANKRMYAGFEGGAIYLAEEGGKYYVIEDEGTMDGFLDPVENADLLDSLVRVHKFLSDEARADCLPDMRG